MNGIVVFIGALFLLSIGRPVFVPILVSVFLWYLINSIAAYYRKIMPWRESIVTGSIAGLLSLATLGGFIYLFIVRIRPMFAELIDRLPKIQERLNFLLQYASEKIGFSIPTDGLPDMSQVVSGVGMSALSVAVTLGLVLVYIFFMFVEQSTFAKKLSRMFPEKRKFKKLSFILKSIDENMKKYMFMKTLVSVLTAVASYFWLKYLGLEFASVWAFLIFLFNYVPTFGSILAAAVPITYALLVADSMHMPILVASGLIVLQIVLGNILEPRLMGKTLNLSTLAILINLVIWGMLWGAVGAFFSVPLLVATFIITAQFDSTRWIAVLLSANGEIPAKEE